MPLAILILAAGASARMRGADKLLERIDGVAQLARVAQSALQTGCAVWVALPSDRPARAALVARSAATSVIVPEAAEGMAAPIRAGLAAIPPGPVMILLADLPEITADDLSTLIAAHARMPDRIIRATAQSGQPGHPVIFPDWARPALAALQGDSGARDFLRAQVTRTEPIALPGNHATTDLDTPEDWAAWRANRHNG